MKADGFESESCKVEYSDETKTVLIKWKKYCEFEDYRNPTIFALELLRKNKRSNLMIDARNGFEDNKEDVEWGFNYLLPEMGRTTCKFVVFIMNEVNDIEHEMNMWEKEFKKYFTVYKSDSMETGVLMITRSGT